MPFATASDATRIHYDIYGKRTPGALCPVVLLHGFGLSARFWFELPDTLAEGTGRRIVTPDNRGTGSSGRARRLYVMAGLADDVAAVLDDAGIAEAVIVGISFGGMIAQHFALRHPARTHGLVLLATSPGWPLAQAPSPQWIVALLAKVLLFRKTNARVFDRMLLPESAVPQARTLFAAWPAAAAIDPFTARTCLAQVGAVLGHAPGDALQSIRCPTVIVAGADDVLVPPENSAILARAIPGSALEILPGVAHAVPTIDHDVIARSLRRIESMGEADAAPPPLPRLQRPLRAAAS